VSVVGVAAAKGSPGVTTTVLALASAWPASRRLTMIDLDLAGGDVAGWLELPEVPNVSTLAADCRHGIDAETLLANVRPLPGRGAVQVLAGARTPDEGAVAAELLCRAGFEELVTVLSVDGDVLIDLGRLDPNTTLSPVLAVLDELLVVLRPTWSQVHHVGARLGAWSASARVGVVLVGDRPYGAGEVGEALGVPVAGVLADDAAAAGALSGARVRARGLERTRLWRSAAALSDHLVPATIDLTDVGDARAGVAS
jgi:MinD-like ATPase involved in chromosome partitioning or flagellar assembly